MNRLKCFAIKHGGVYLGGFTIVFAVNIENARHTFNDNVRIGGNTPTIYSIEQIVPKLNGVTVLWDGDY